MALNAKNQAMPEKSGTTQEPLEAGNYLARLVQVVDLGVQAQRPFKGEAKPPVHMINLTYELCTEFMKDEDGKDVEDKPRWIGERIPFHNLKVDLAKSTKRIKAIDPKLTKDGDLSEMLGMPCTVTVVVDTNTKTDKTYANVGNITPPMKGIPVPELKNEVSLFELDSPDLEVFKGIPDWLQDIIKENLEYDGSPLQKALGETPKPEKPPVKEGDSNDNPY